MIHVAHFSPKDREARSKVVASPSTIANTFDYSNVYVPKPWGGEYLIAQNEQIALWGLSIKRDKSTSLHCHEHKWTALVVMTGFAKCSTLTNEYVLAPGDVVLIAPGVFHSTRALGGDIRVIEAETPPMKGDLVRLSDENGRKDSAYESPETYQRNPVLDVDPMQIQDCVDIAIKCLNQRGQD